MYRRVRATPRVLLKSFTNLNFRVQRVFHVKLQFRSTLLLPNSEHRNFQFHFNNLGALSLEFGACYFIVLVNIYILYYNVKSNAYYCACLCHSYFQY